MMLQKHEPFSSRGSRSEKGDALCNNSNCKSSDFFGITLQEL